MTDQEFKQLIKESEIFKAMAPEVQKAVLESTGEKREEFIRIFADLKNNNAAAAKEFLEKNNELLKKFKDETKANQKTFFKKGEEKSKISDENESDKLINMINNL